MFLVSAYALGTGRLDLEVSVPPVLSHDPQTGATPLRGVRMALQDPSVEPSGHRPDLLRPSGSVATVPLEALADARLARWR